MNEKVKSKKKQRVSRPLCENCIKLSINKICQWNGSYRKNKACAPVDEMYTRILCTFVKSSTQTDQFISQGKKVLGEHPIYPGAVITMQREWCLKALEIIKKLQNDKKTLRDRLEASLRIKDLWLPDVDSVKPEHQEELKALQIMAQDFEVVLEETK